MGQRIAASFDVEVIERRLTKLPAVSFIDWLDGSRAMKVICCCGFKETVTPHGGEDEKRFTRELGSRGKAEMKS